MLTFVASSSALIDISKDLNFALASSAAATNGADCISSSFATF